MAWGSRSLSITVVLALVLGAACSSTSTNESSSGGSGGASGSSGTGGTTASDCCTARTEPGCTDKNIQACVCGFDPNCCSSQWTSLCVGVAELNCNACGSTGGSGGTGGWEPIGGAAGANPGCPTAPGGMCPSASANSGSDCCTYGKGMCSDMNLFDCATALSQDCAAVWTDCCVDIVIGQGLCDGVASGDAGP